ncbi:hypothetical protein Tco_1568998 [Tanacetum coccineum]
MLTQQDIYVAGSENRPPMLNKDNYVPWSSRILCDLDREVLIAETFHEQTDDELTNNEVKQIEADDQAIQTILMGLPEDIYAAVDSCETAQEIWLRVQQMMKGYCNISHFQGSVFWGAERGDYPDGGVPRVIVLGYDGLPMQPVDPPSPDYVLARAPTISDYVPDPVPNHHQH